MAQEQKESIDRTFAQFMQPGLGFRTCVSNIDFVPFAADNMHPRPTWLYSKDKRKDRERRF